MEKLVKHDARPSAGRQAEKSLVRMKHPRNLQDLLFSLLPLLQVHFGIVLEDWSTALVLVVNANSTLLGSQVVNAKSTLLGSRAKERGDRGVFFPKRDACFKLDRRWLLVTS